MPCALCAVTNDQPRKLRPRKFLRLDCLASGCLGVAARPHERVASGAGGVGAGGRGAACEADSHTRSQFSLSVLGGLWCRGGKGGVDLQVRTRGDTSLRCKCNHTMFSLSFCHSVDFGAAGVGSWGRGGSLQGTVTHKASFQSLIL